MTSKEFVLSKYPTAVVFCNRYDNRARCTTYWILDSTKGLNGVLFYAPNNTTPSKAWVNAKKQILETGKSNQE